MTSAARAARAASILALSSLAAVWSASPGLAQDEPINGMRQADLRAHAIVDATVVLRPGEPIEHATIVIRDGVIEAVGANIDVPPDAQVWEATGFTVYAGLIDAAVMVTPGVLERGPGSHWNRQVHPEINAVERDMPGEANAQPLRELGFTAAAVYPDNGILRGSGAVVSLAGGEFRPAVYRERAAMAGGFDRGGGYPGSLMGAIAVLRQTLFDAQWHQTSKRVWEGYPQGHEPPARSDALASLDDLISGRQTLLFEADDEHNFLRAARIIHEFNLEAMILGSGTEFRRLSDVAATGLPIILPLSYPERPDVTTLAQADAATLQSLQTWEQAPTNARRLLGAGATIALTTHDLRAKNQFHANLRRAIVNGLSEEEALAALTTVPAKMLGLDHVLGTIEPGKVANLVVVEGSLFNKEGKIRDTWIDGRRYEITAPDDPAYTGAGVLRVTRADGEPIETKVAIDTKKSTVEVTLPEGGEAKAKKVAFDGARLSFLLDGRLFDESGYAQFTGALTDGSFAGSGAMPDLSQFTFTITPTDEPVDVQAEEPDESEGDEPDGEDEGDESSSGPGPDDDGISGEWSAVLTAAQMPEPLSVSLNFSYNGGTLTGSLTSEFFSADINEGTYNPATGDIRYTLSGGGMVTTTTGTVRNNRLTGQVTAQGGGFTAEIAGDRAGAQGDSGQGRSARGGDRKKEDPEETDVAPENLTIPLGEYGLREVPQSQNIMIDNATIWTCGPDGIIEGGSLLIMDGKIAAVYRTPPDSSLVPRFDAQGKHVTPGLIDCHSHTGISGGVNEGSQAVTAEVRIADCINPDDIDFYRQLAGGLTACNQLHGSANPIGGQNSVVKLKWGSSAAEFPIRDAIPGIKFALGENVKRSENRYPNTRMGVETVMRDAFTAARHYKEEWDRYEALPKDRQGRTMPPPRDIELDTLVEILEGRRLVHCHSYRQDEILMLLRLADDFGFRIGTLQHILEGYKVAEAIVKHGAGASSFSDWWAYKVEVMDAIPYNGAIMHDVGIVVSFNSDSNELARRMNTEAAKAVRYGGIEPEEALKFVTINPAKQLRIDHRVGSLEAGKDADFVIWSGDPLSSYTRCEQTWIEGARYFSIEDDARMREEIAAERRRLIQKVLAFTHGEAEEGDAKDEASSNTSEPAEESQSDDGIFDFSADLPF